MVAINLSGLLLFFILLYSVKSDEILPKNNTEEYNNQIQQILEYLNSKSAIYLYKTANLLSAQNQESSEIVLNFNVQVDCRSENIELCAHTEFSCTTTLDTALNPMQKSLNCVPLKVETASSPTSDFIPIRRRQRVCPGCPVDLNPNARGIEAFTDAATKMIESESEYRIKPLKVLKVQRQVLATVPAKVRYILNIDFADTSCLKTSEVSFDECRVNEATVRVCEVEFVDQTQLTRTKHIVKNNCTVVQDFVTESVVETSVFEDVAHGRQPVPGNNDMDNEIDVTYDFQKSSDASDNNERERGTPNYDAIAENGNADDILKWTNSKHQGTMQSKLEDIESQIIIFKDKSASATPPTVNSQFNVVTESVFIKDEIKKDEAFVTSSTVASDMTNDDKQLAIDGLIDLFNFDSSPKIQKATQSQLNVEFQQTKPVIEDLIIPVKAVIRFQESSITDPKIETPTIGVADTDTTIHITNTDSKYIDNKFNEEGSVIPSMSRKKRNLNVTRLQMEPTSEEEQEFVASLAELATQTLDNIDSDDHRRIVLKILNSKKVQSDGIVYYLTLKVAVSECSEQTIPDEEHTQKEQKHEIESDVNCRHRLLNDMTMICKVQVHVTNQKTEPKVIKSQCQVLRKTVERNNRTGGRSKRQVLGAPLKFDEEDNYFKELAQEVLLRFDEMSDVSNQHKIIKVKNATRQLVAGTLVKMEIIVGLSQLRKGVPATFAARKDAKLLEDAQERTCSVSIWDRPWIKSGRNISINCDEKNNNIKRSNMKQKFGSNEESYDIKLFNEFLIKHNKIYHSKKEYLKRYETFRKNLKIIKKLNDYEMGTGIYGPTIFADMNEKEYRRYLGLNIALKHDNHIPFPKAIIPDTSNLPKSFDWREKGAVTAVKNQGSCGSCWAFSVTGNIEGQYAIKNNKLLEFSEQELVDCDKLDSGCEGGLPDNAYRAIEQIGGLETESDYPYDAADEKCYFNSTLSKVQISGGLNISSNETEMAAWLVSHGPISIGINANAMQFYVGGVSHPWKFLCDSKNLDHGVLIVGYGIKKYPLFNKTLPYWIVKNSWGRRWGEQGYYRVYRGDGTCGLNQMASSAVLGD